MCDIADIHAADIHAAFWTMIRAADIHAAKRASLLVLQINPTARQICLRSGGDSFMEVWVFQLLSFFFSPGSRGEGPCTDPLAVGSTYGANRV